MPATISIAAFIMGLLLVVAALIGQAIEAKEVKLPAITGRKHIIIGFFGAFLMLFGINDGKLWPQSASAPVLATYAISNTPAGNGRVKIGDPHLLPNQARIRVASIKVEYGCVVLLSHPNNEDNAYRICQDTPMLPAEWQTRTVRIGADCATRTDKGPIALVFANPNFEDRTWEYSFAC